MPRGRGRAPAPPGPGKASLRWGIRALGAMALFLALWTVVRAEEDPVRPIGPDQVRERVAAWLDDLSSPSFAVREAARRGLKRYGQGARDLLEARRDDADPEVRRTVLALLERLGEAPRAVASPASDLGDMGRVSLSARGRVRDLLAAVGREHGASFTFPDGRGDEEVSVSIETTPFFDAVRRIAAEGGLEPHGRFDVGGRLSLRAAAEVDDLPTATAGPLRAVAAEVTAVRALGRNPRRRYRVGLDVDWPPSVQPVQHRTPRDIAAEDGAGRTYVASPAMRTVTTYGISTSARHHRIELHLEPSVEDATEHLAELTFTLPVRLLHDRAQVRFALGDAPVLPATRQPSGQAAPPDQVGSVTLRAVKRVKGDRGPWLVELQARLRTPTLARYLRVWLERADGSLQLANLGSRMPSSDGLLEVSARAYGREDEPPMAVRVTWFRAVRDGELSFELRDVPLR